MTTHRRLLQILSSIVILTMLFSGFSLPLVSAQGKDGLKRQVNPQTGRVSFLEPESGRALSASRALGTFIRPQNPAMALAKRFGSEFGLKNPERDLKEMKTHQAEDGRIMARYQQKYQGIPVMGGELIVNTNEDGDLYSMNGEVSSDLSLSTQPAIDAEQAKQAALQAVAKWNQKTTDDFLASEPELWIFDESLLRPSTRPAELVWRMEVTPKDVGKPVRELVLVNAQRGSISLHFNQIDTAWTPNESSGAFQDPNPTPAPLPTETPESVVTPGSTEEASTSNESISDVTALTGVTWYVATTGSDANSCSSAGSPCKTINGAIGKATAGDTVKVAIGTYTGTGVQVVLIDKSITLSGGWNANFTAQSGLSIIDGEASRRGAIVSGNSVLIDHFRIQNGYTPPDTGSGAGIINSGTLTLSNSIVSGNVSLSMGGGIYNQGTLVINNTIISDNVASGGFGAGIENYNGGVTLNNSTVSGNILRMGVSGGGIHNFDGLSTFTINNSTISGNRGTGIHDDGRGTMFLNNSTISGNTFNGVYKGEGHLTINNSTITANKYGLTADLAASVTTKNSIIAVNTDFDCSGVVVSAVYNLIGDNINCQMTPTVGDLIGTSLIPLDPRLSPLQNNGGPTLTHALLADSPAVNAGNPGLPGSGGNTCLAKDQRGVARPLNGRCDIGAFESSWSWTPPYLVSTYTTGDTSALPGTFVCDQTDKDCMAGDSQAKKAHQYAIGTYNLYSVEYGRNSLDNKGMKIISTVHYCDPNDTCPYDNANWNGSQVVYGDASGWPLADDVVAHELTHGVTQYESNLFYYYQSGAINESFSDLWGEYYDQSNGLENDSAGVKWLIGEDVSGLGAIRSMSNPPDFGDPDTMSSPDYWFGPEDNGGVHHNSGINNKAVYLMVDGAGYVFGWAKTAAIYYQANTNLLTSGADYSDLYYALEQACINIIGQKGITVQDCYKVRETLDQVEMNFQFPTFNADAPYCDGTTTPLFADNLENGTGNWTFTNGAYPRWQLDSSFYGPYAQSGLHSLYADDYPGKVTDATAKLISLAIPNNAFLWFAQAYDFESGYNTGDPTFYNFDGSVLEYSLNNGSSWVDAGSLIDFNGYTGTIFTGANNPLSGRSAFVGASHGYISTRLNLASLAGQTVSFRWRMGLDEAAYAGGWWVDSIKVYTCNVLPPAAFNKASPANGGTGVGLSTTLSWGSSSGAAYYQYCYDILNDNQCNRTWSAPINATSGGISNLGTSTTYYWQVRAVNTGGTTYANNQTWGSFTTTSTLPAGMGSIETFISTTKQGKYSLGSGQSLRESYSGVNNGPIKITSTNAIPFIGAERVIYNVNSVPTSFSEMMALPDGQLDNTYWMPWYNNVDLDTQLRFGNVSGTPATVHVWIGTQEMITGCNPSNIPYPYVLAAGASLRVSCPGVNNGPVQIVSNQNIVAAERVIYNVNGAPTSFSEMMGLPNGQLDKTYWLPWYNNVDLDTQLRFGNVSNSPATVHVWIGGQEMTTGCPSNIPYPYVLAAGASLRVSCPGVNNGPVQIISDVNIVAAERVIYNVNGVPTSFSEIMALPNGQLDTAYWLPWYNNIDLDTQLRFGNVGSSPATVHVWIGGQEMTNSCPSNIPYPFVLATGESLRVSCPGVNNGPVQIISDGNIVAAERVIYNVNGAPTSFSEMMALPDSQLDNTYWLPWYNNVDLDTQLRFGVP